MKKFFYLSVVLVSIMFVSCVVDFTNPQMLSGTTWRCNDFKGNQFLITHYDYLDLRFINTTNVESWAKIKDGNVEKLTSASYTIQNKILRLHYEGQAKEDTLTIDKTTMNSVYDGTVLQLIKQ